MLAVADKKYKVVHASCILQLKTAALFFYTCNKNIFVTEIIILRIKKNQIGFRSFLGFLYSNQFFPNPVYYSW